MLKSVVCLVCHQHQKFSFIYHGFKYYRCPHCGLVTTLPLPTDSQITDHYQQKFNQGNYELLRRYAPDYMKVYQDMAKRLSLYCRQHQKSLKKAKLLDIGTFTGEYMEAASQLGADVYGTELQSEAVKIANQKFPGKIIEANILNTAFPHQNFDIITLLGLIEHVVNPDKLMTRVAKLLKPNGLIMIQTPNAGSLLARSMGKYWPPYAPIEHIHLFSRQSLELLLHQNGFDNLTYQPHVKKLPVNYIYQNLQNFGPEFHHLLKPLAPIITRSHLSLPVYGGEMIMLGQKL